MPTNFKLKFDDLTRRVSFTKQPSWPELSEKISTLYAIPQHQVGVTYFDAENEEITLSTEEELQDYYFSSYRPGETIKFSVRDLTSRNQRSSVPANAGIRNTFGQFVDPEIPGLDEWQAVNNIPSLEEILGQTFTSDVQSAFVESIASEGSTVGKTVNNTLGAEVVEDAHSEISEPHFSSEEKGKERAQSIRSISSTRSLLAADIGDKHPVHVYDVSTRKQSALANELSFHEAGDTIAAESTPRVSTSFLKQDAPAPETEIEQIREVDDPPLPSLETSEPQLPHAADTTQSAQLTQTSASIARDAAAFLTTISSIISSHPEVGESLRTIVRNTTNGTYWASHRETLSQAAAELQRNTENLAEDSRRVVEEEAGKRVADALAGVLRIFSQAQSNSQGGANQAFNSDITTNSNTQQPDNMTVPPSNEAGPQSTEPLSHTPPMPGAFATANFDTDFGGSFPFNHRRGGWHHGWRARASMPPNFGVGSGFPGWAVPSVRPPFGPGVLNAAAPTTSSGTAPFFHNTFTSASGPDTNPLQPKAEASSNAEAHERLSPQESKAKVEEAKRAYRAEKERYRRERDERKMEKDKEKTAIKEDVINNSQNPDVTTSSGKDAFIAANARHGFPRFDIVNVTEAAPQRHNTHLGHFPRRHERPADDLFTRAVNRISRRLADMGFTEKAYPDLPQKIKNYLPTDGAIAKDSEDDIVTTLLEAMLATPKSPVASGSGARDIPGSWH
ncbi:hypothetical protein AN958_06672 [Leucoagaricus sp. SymC.cos]|nr:hypothetical protein AN958_06672 [Leucoagaricus sp. SymC.cos]